jgi:transposase
MLYLGIDQHRKQLTINLRNDAGDVLLKRQVSTRWAAVRGFFADLQTRCEPDGGYLAIVEVCGFNHWLLALLKEQGCRQVILVQAERRRKQKTDRRDANQLGELLWVNRRRLQEGKKVQQLRVVQPASPTDDQARQVTALLRRASQKQTRTLNGIHHLLLKHNLHQECPTKGLQTKRARKWLAQLALPAIDRLEMDQLLEQWELWERQLAALRTEVELQQQAHPAAMLLATMPGAGAFSSLGLACRVGDVARFEEPGSLANYWGLTPSCRNSGEAQQRLGSITKQGSDMARFILGQLVLHVLRRDAAARCWYQRIKTRRGSKIARVAVMRRLATIIWHMLKHDQPYHLGASPSGRGHEDLSVACATEAIERCAQRNPWQTSARTRQKGAAPSTLIAAPASG